MLICGLFNLDLQMPKLNNKPFKIDPQPDPIRPAHYKGDLVMRIIEKFKLGFRLANVVKYILRHKEKAGLEDLKKARWYLDREITAQEGKLGPELE